MMMKLNDFQKYDVTLLIPYEKYFELIYETKYLLEARLNSDRIFVAQKSFFGCNRRTAVSKASDWYNKALKKVLGHPHDKMFVNDPCGEVVYDQGFVCTDLRNKYLDDPTIDRLIKEAGGDLGREDTKTPAASVKRLRKRRKQEVQLTDRLIQSSGGTIYYKMTELCDSKTGRSKVRKIKLASKSLIKAKKEVVRRGLDRFENFADTKELLPLKLSTSAKAA
tara:strand:+ start:2735 stop:3400 length:666 start_codon:yes stop_codon:yes gene_type:complete